MEKFFLICMICLFAFGCQNEGAKFSQESSLESFLARGAKQSRKDTGTAQSLSLASEDTDQIESGENEQGHMIRWMEFDTDRMPIIEAKNLHDYLMEFISNQNLLTHANIESTFDQQLLSQQTLSSKLIAITYGQQIENIPVHSAFFQVFFLKSEEGYRLRSINNQLVDLGNVSRPDSSYFAPTLDDLKSVTGWSDLKVLNKQLEWRENIEVSADVLELATKFTVERQGIRYTLVLQNSSGKVISAFRHNLHQEKRVVASIAQGEGDNRHSSKHALALTSVKVEGKVFKSGYDGEVSGAISPNVVLLDSPRVRVYSGEIETNVSEFLVNPSDEPSVLEIEGTNSEVHSFALIQKINRFARQYYAPSELPFLDQPISVYTRVQGECNAFYTTGLRKITFYKESFYCNDSAMVDDVVFHEWGHALDDHTGKEPGVTDSAFSEGLADVVAAFYTRDPVIGRDFYKHHSQGIRDLRDLKIYPRDTGSAHEEGQIISSTFWELRKRLIKRYGEARGHEHAAYLFFRHLMLADSYLDSYRLVLALDDGDGNPANRSANYCLINEVFARHGLADNLACQDQYDPVYEPTFIDHDIHVALLDGDQASQIKVFVSSAYASEVSLCFLPRTECLENSKERTRLILQEVTDRRFFKLPYGIDVREPAVMTIVAKNNEGLIIGSREMKLFSK